MKNSKPKAGDKVKIITDKEEFEGILMPRPELLEKGYTVVKLDNGYNIGIKDKKIKQIKLLKKYTQKKSASKKLPIKKGLPTVSVISLGGTISSKIDYRTGGVYADYTAEDFVAMMPELAEVANLKAKKVMNIMSEDLTGKDYTKIAKIIEDELKQTDGVVVTQGTDTLHFSTAAMSFMLNNLNKPVVFTAAQRSIDRGSSDAFMNLICAVNVAAQSDIAEVVTCLHGTTNDDYCIINKGAKVRKMHTSRRDAFRPVNDLPIAKVYADGKIEIVNKEYNKRSKKTINLKNKFEEDAGLIFTYPGIKPEVIDYYKNYKGLVIAATGLGNIPANLFPKIEKLKIPVVIAPQTIYGRVHPLVYAHLRELSIKLKCIFAEDMTPETAYIKLGWVLAQTTDPKKVKELMLTNITGEITERSLDKSFLY